MENLTYLFNLNYQNMHSNLHKHGKLFQKTKAVVDPKTTLIFLRRHTSQHRRSGDMCRPSGYAVTTASAVINNAVAPSKAFTNDFLF